MGGGGEDRAALVLQNFQPRGEVGGVVVADLRGEFEIGAQESGAQLGDEFLGGIAFVAPALASEITVKTGRMFYPVNTFVAKRGVKFLSIGESLNRRHLDVVKFLRVVGPVAAITDFGSRGSEELIGMSDALDR